MMILHSFCDDDVVMMSKKYLQQNSLQTVIMLAAAWMEHPSSPCLGGGGWNLAERCQKV
jgi:hypothetical protein